MAQNSALRSVSDMIFASVTLMAPDACKKHSHAMPFRFRIALLALLDALGSDAAQGVHPQPTAALRLYWPGLLTAEAVWKRGSVVSFRKATGDRDGGFH